jgi:hypothetical protein
LGQHYRFNLIYLTVGYWLGGKIADKYPSITAISTDFDVGEHDSGVGADDITSNSENTANAFDQFQMPILAGAFVTVMVLFVIPVTLLGMVSPFALKLSLRDAQMLGKPLVGFLQFLL